MGSREQKQIEVLKEWIAEIAPQLNMDLSIKLWNGDILPLGKNAQKKILIAVNSPEVIRRLIFSPKLTTLFELYAEGLLDIEGGTPLEASKLWDHIAIVEFAKTINKTKLAKRLWPFVMLKGNKLQSSSFSYDNTSDRIIDSSNIEELVRFHYDISNRFFKLFLDPQMVYASAYFKDKNMKLADAQKAKLDLICKKLRLKEGERLLDIGCGWGALVCHAAQNYGVKAHGVTLSKAQYDYAIKKVHRLGLEDKVTIEFRDYKTLDNFASYHKITQTGIFEYVGIDNHQEYFKHIWKLLKPRGLYLHEATTRRVTPDLNQFRKKSAYQEVINRYIFPGGELDYIGLSITNLERQGFEIVDVESMRTHSYLTLKRWLKRLSRHKDEARVEIGLPKTRLWLLYLSLSAIGFERGTLNVYQTLVYKRRTGLSKLPLTRDDIYCN